MQGFRQSRGRIFFDTLCAFGMSATCALAWMQTYADALLGAAGIAGLYGLVRFTDMFRRAPVVEQAEEPVVKAVEVIAPQPVTDVADYETLAPEPVELPEPKLELPPAKHELPPEVVAALVRKPKRKTTKRPAKAEPVAEEPTAVEPEAIDILPSAPEPEALDVVEPDSEYSAPIAPLFEPEPFVRKQQRAAFGRKFGVR